ncbi:hypothetical protein MFIFM68171_06523 [Madurella fahalii]|uniref:Cytochrome P450 n=1 Tax=Madurella fahalii TaxID=1157608 RepID=A0ABQ0GF02_9PEZI
MGLSIWLAGMVVSSLLGYVYWGLFPVPLPGIPYDVKSSKRLLGDLNQIKEQGRLSREITEGMFAVARRLRSPIAQLLGTAWSRKIVVVDDAREAEDILTRRHQDFDRSMVTSQFFIPMFPHSTISQATTPGLKAQKRLWSGVMSPAFLDGVVAPHIQQSAQELVELWRLRARRSENESFDVSEDFAKTALDAIWAAILGSQLGVMRREIERFEAASGKRGTSNPPYTVPETPCNVASAAVVQEAVEYLNKIVDVGFTSVWPRLSFFLIQLTPTYRRFKRITDDGIRDLMARAVGRYQRIETLESETDGEELDTCAMDLVLRREVLTARKSGHSLPDPTKDPSMLEELLFMLIAGHESTASSLSWFVKLIALHPTVQSALRSALQSAFPNDQSPPAAAILAAPLPYLDAVLEETIRVSAPAGIIARVARVDTTILSCPIPKGTHVLMNTRFQARPAWTVSEDVRSESSRVGQVKRAKGGGLEGPSGQELDRFDPRRWLVVDEETGREVFDGNALPSLVFGGGYRGCFGKKLAMKEMRIIITLMILNFEFLPLFAELSSMAAEERLFRRPRTCHVKLRPL